MAVPENRQPSFAAVARPAPAGTVRERGVRLLWGLTLLSLPWVGADLILLLTGRDAGVGLQPSWLLMALLWVFAWRFVAFRNAPRMVPWVGGAMLVAVAVSAGGLWAAPADAPPGVAMTRYFKQSAQLAIMASFAVWPILNLRGCDAWRRTARWLVAGALVQVAYGAAQQVAFYHPLPALTALERIFTSNPSILSGSGQLYVGDRFLAVPRLRGTACEPLYLGNYLLLVIPMVFLTGWRRRWQGAALGALGLLLLLTWSRGAWLGAGAGLVFALALSRGAGASRRHSAPRRRAGWGLVAIMLLSGLVMVAWAPARLPVQRLLQSFSTHDWSNLTRLYSVQAAWRAFCLSPVCGIGWGQFGWHFAGLVDPAGLQAMFTWPVVANFPMLVLCETGLVGFGALLATGVGAARAVAGRARGAAPAELVAATAAVAGIGVQALTFSQYNLAHAWIALGLLGAALLRETETAGGGGAS